MACEPRRLRSAGALGPVAALVAAGRQAWRRDRGWRWLCLLGAALFVLLFKPWVHGDDGVRYYAYLRSMVVDGDLDFRNEFVHYADRTIDVLRIDPDTGRVANAVPCGSAVLWAPWFLAVHGALALGGALGLATAPADGYGAPYVVAISLASAVHAFLGVLMLYALLRRFFAVAPALAAVVAVWLASPLVFYMYAHPSMAHANSFFAASALLLACARWGASRRWIHWAAMGALAGLAMLVRFNNLLLILFPMFAWVALAVQTARSDESAGERRAALGRLVALGAVCALCACLVFAPQLAAWKYMHGAWLAGPRDFKLDQDLSVWRSPHLLETLFSGRRGVFFWMPAAGLAVAGWALATSLPLALRLAAPMVFFLTAWMVGGWVMWWGGASFGPRFFIGCLPGLALGLAATFRALGRRRLVGALVAALVVWNFGLMAQYALRMIDREGPLDGARVLRNQWRVPGEIVRRADAIIHRRDVAPAPDSAPDSAPAAPADGEAPTP